MHIIDSHSHIGLDNAWNIEGSLDEYIKKTKELGIKESILMPVPMPIIKVGQKEITPIMLGTYGEEYYIVQGIKDNYGSRGICVSENPYKYVNEILFRKIKEKNIHFVPLVHPYFDNYEYLQKMVEKYHPIALKIHGYSSIIEPNNISEDFWNVIKEINIPIIIHTDCDTSNEESLDWYYRNENAPLNWIKILEKHSIKGYITHGARLCEKSIKLVNDNPNFVIGLGPDLLLSKSHDRMYSNDPYLEKIFDEVEIDRICFDLDYPWNVESYEEKELDWNSLDRIKKLELSKDELSKVLSLNSKRFFKI